MTEIFRRDYEGYTITLDDERLRFAVHGDGFKGEFFRSYDEATAAIDAMVKTEARAKQAKSHIPVLDDRGKPAVVTGIHRGTGNLTGSVGEGDAFPPNDDLAVVLAEYQRTSAILKRLAETVQPYRLRRGRGYGRVASPEMYDDLLRVFLADLVNAAETASKDEKLRKTAGWIRGRPLGTPNAVMP